MLEISRSGHIGGSFSIAEILAVLYFKQMSVNPLDPKDLCATDLSCQRALYANSVFSPAHKGFFPIEHLETFRKIDSNLSGHYCRCARCRCFNRVVRAGTVCSCRNGSSSSGRWF